MSDWPYEYGSDLHWLWDWGERIKDRLRKELPISDLERMIFRPDRLARNAMMRYSIKYPHVIKQVDDCLGFVEVQYSRYVGAETDANAENLATNMGLLSERIRVAAETIADAEGVGRRTGDVDDSKRPAYDRDHLWLSWLESDELGPAKIRDKWDAMSDDERKAICPKCWERIGDVDKKAGREVVKTGLGKAKLEK